MLFRLRFKLIYEIEEVFQSNQASYILDGRIAVNAAKNSVRMTIDN